jgi:hypothetical protein
LHLSLNDTHISLTPRPNGLIRYIGRNGGATQNVSAIVDFDMRFTYASIGQLGSMHDTNVLIHALQLDSNTFPHTPLGMSGHLSSLFLMYIPKCMWLIAPSFLTCVFMKILHG